MQAEQLKELVVDALDDLKAVNTVTLASTDPAFPCPERGRFLGANEILVLDSRHFIGSIADAGQLRASDSTTHGAHSYTRMAGCVVGASDFGKK